MYFTKKSWKSYFLERISPTISFILVGGIFIFLIIIINLVCFYDNTIVIDKIFLKREKKTMNVISPHF